MILTKLRFENQQKKTPLAKKIKQAFIFSLLCFQLFVDLFVTSAGFKPATAGAEIQCAIQLRHEAFNLSQ